MTRRTSLVSTLIAGLTLAIAAPVAAGGSFGPPTVVVGTDLSATLRVGDVAAAGDTVIVAFVRERPTDNEVPDRASLFSRSFDGGGTFDAEDVDDLQALRVEACPDGSLPPESILLAATTLSGGDRRITASNGSTSTQFGVEGADSSRPGIACVPGKRVAVVYLRTQGGTTTARLRTFRLGTPTISLVTDVSLGAANKGSTPAVAAVGDRIYVAWTGGNQLRFKRFVVGGAPSFSLTAKPTVTIETSNSQRAPRLAADGSGCCSHGSARQTSWPG